MSKQTFSPQAAMDMLQKEEKMLRRNVPRLKITEPIVTALFDNLGKGASGAAVQNMNIMLGLDEGLGLNP